MTSYLVQLFDVLKPKCKDFSTNISFGPSRTILTTTYFGLEELSAYKVHHSPSKTHSPCKLLVKSTKHQAFIGPLGSYRIAKFDNSTNHNNILFVRSSFCIIFCIGQLILTTTLWLWMQGRSLLAVVTRERDPFSPPLSRLSSM